MKAFSCNGKPLSVQFWLWKAANWSAKSREASTPGNRLINVGYPVKLSCSNSVRLY